MSKVVLVPMADGAEDMELVGIIDILKRAKSIGAELEIVCASIKDDKAVRMDNGIVVMAETTLSEVADKEYDAVVLAGGLTGMTNLKADSRIIELVKKTHAKGGIVAGFCASPVVLWDAGVLSDEYTCYPGCDMTIVNKKRLDDAVVVRENVITGAGPAVVLPFILTILKELGFTDEVEELTDAMLLSTYGFDKLMA